MELAVIVALAAWAALSLLLAAPIGAALAGMQRLSAQHERARWRAPRDDVPVSSRRARPAGRPSRSVAAVR